MPPIVPAALQNPRISSRFVTANGIRFEVDECVPEHANGKLALCLHGFPEHSFSWRFQLPMLADQGYLAWAPNLRGYGHSDKPDGRSAYAIEYLMEDVAALIDQAGCDQVLLLAHDWGAVIAWYFAMRKLRPLEQLVICNVPHPQSMQGKLSWSQLKKSWYIFFFQLPAVPEWLFGRNNGQSMGQIMASSAIDKTNFDAAVGEVYRANAMQPKALTSMINYYRALISGGGAQRQQQLGYPIIDVPTLMVWGEADVALDKATTHGTEKYVRDLTLRYLPNVSHWVQQEQPEVVNAMITAFIQGKPVPEMHWQAVLEAPAG